jgi:hypothetical protein
MEPNVFLEYIGKDIVGVLNILGMSNTPLKVT